MTSMIEPRISRMRPSATGNIWAELRGSLRHPDFWAYSSWLEILVRARKSRLGVLWLMAPSILYVFGLGSFFAAIQGKSFPEIAPHVALGSMLFRTLMTTVIGSASVFSASQSFILDGHVRLTDYLLQTIARSLFDVLMYMPVLVVALWLAPHVYWQGLVVAPFTLCLVYINAFWISAIFGIVGARLPDLSHLLANISIFLFLFTPIIWFADAIPADSVQGRFMRFNPFFHFVEVFRAPILGEPVAISSFWYLGVMTSVGVVLATWVYRRYARFVPLWI